MEKINIFSKRLKVRNLKSTDLEDFYIYRSNPEITKYQGFDVMNREESKDFIYGQKDKLFGKPGEWVQYGIENRSSNRIVGDCAIKLDKNDGRIAEIGITISHLYQKKGYAKEAFTAIIEFLFNVMNIHRIVETVDVENEASIQLMESMGFRKEGHFIENIYFNNKWGSEYMYAMLQREWKKTIKLDNLFIK
ncbi:MAG: N-acetyltransferase [Bacteroidetes bacterium]|nr:MAG: N-acetyltransferase [Bacteroidota bacterium]